MVCWLEGERCQNKQEWLYQIWVWAISFVDETPCFVTCLLQFAWWQYYITNKWLRPFHSTQNDCSRFNNNMTTNINSINKSISKPPTSTWYSIAAAAAASAAASLDDVSLASTHHWQLLPWLPYLVQPWQSQMSPARWVSRIPSDRCFVRRSLKIEIANLRLCFSVNEIVYSWALRLQTSALKAVFSAPGYTL